MDFSDPQLWIALGTLTLLEIVLGIDNIVFISIVSGRLPEHQQANARRIGLAMALLTRVLLLIGLAWVVKLDTPFYTMTVFSITIPLSGKAIVLLVGGLFLIWKSTREIHHKLEADPEAQHRPAKNGFRGAIIQIMILDMVFSLDSVITAIGMVDQVPVMITAVVISMIIMLIFVNSIGNFVDRHPTVKMLALSFLILIGVMLVAEGVGHHIPKGYIYFAMAFAIGVECLNMKAKQTTVKKQSS